MTRPEVTVVVPVYDRTHMLVTCIRSLFNQETEFEFEIIVVCDGSPDSARNTLTWLRDEAPCRMSVYSFSESSGNASRGRNLGISAARGQYVAFADSDDVSHPRRLQLSRDALDNFGYQVVAGAARYVSDGSRMAPTISNSSGSEDITYGVLLLGNPIVTSTVMVERQVLLEFGGFRTSMQYREDHELWLRLAHRGCSFAHLRDILIDYQLHSGNNELVFLDEDDHWRELALKLHEFPYGIEEWGIE